MNTQFIGLKEFRQNISTLSRRAQAKNIRYIVLNKNTPMLDVRPLAGKQTTLEKLAEDVAHAREDIHEGRVYSLKQVRKQLGLI